MRVLIVEDNVEMRAAISRHLQALGNRIDQVGTVKNALIYLQKADYDVAILDRMLPDGDSVCIVETLRSKDVRTPILFLSALDQIDDRVTGLQAGADDYLVKPFAMDELVARVAALSRRGVPPQSSIIQVDDLVMDLGRREVKRAGVLIPLRPKEYTLLELLANRTGHAVSRETILDSCWDVIESPTSNVEESVIASLRRKLGKPVLIKTVRGLGYMLESFHGE